MECPQCGALYGYHRWECPRFHENPDRKGGNPLGLLLLPLLLYVVPFVVVLFPVASLLAIATVIVVNGGVHIDVGRTGILWLALLVAFIPFLLALNVELRLERYRGYRLARHVVRVVGVPWLAAQYLVHGSELMDSPWRAITSMQGSVIAQAAGRPGVLATMAVLAVITHLVGSGFDLNGRRPSTWRDFLWPRHRAGATSAVAPAAAPAGPSIAAPLSRKLAVAIGLGFAVGVIETLVAKDYDSALLVILRVGLLCSVVFCIVVATHHALTRRRAPAR